MSPVIVDEREIKKERQDRAILTRTAVNKTAEILRTLVTFPLYVYTLDTKTEFPGAGFTIGTKTGLAWTLANFLSYNPGEMINVCGYWSNFGYLCVTLNRRLIPTEIFRKVSDLCVEVLSPVAESMNKNLQIAYVG